MNKMAFLSLVYTMLLIIPGPILGKALTKKNVRKERQAEAAARALLPLSSYAGMTVSAPVFLTLVATYGIYAVISYAISTYTYIIQRFLMFDTVFLQCTKWAIFWIPEDPTWHHS